MRQLKKPKQETSCCWRARAMRTTRFSGTARFTSTIVRKHGRRSRGAATMADPRTEESGWETRWKAHGARGSGDRRYALPATGPKRVRQAIRFRFLASQCQHLAAERSEP